MLINLGKKSFECRRCLYLKEEKGFPCNLIAFRPSADVGQVVLETSCSKNISQASPFSSAAKTHVKRRHCSGTRTDSTAFPRAGALVWTMTEVLNTAGAAAAVLPALADGAMAPAAPRREVLLGSALQRQARAPQRFHLMQCFPLLRGFWCGVTGLPDAGGTRAALAWGCTPPAPAGPSEFYHGRQPKMINTGLPP